MKDLIVDLFLALDEGLINIQDLVCDVQEKLNTQQNSSETA